MAAVAMTAATSPAQGRMRRLLRMARSVVTIFLIRGLDTALSFLVGVLLANRFGATSQLDAFFIARRATVGMIELVKQLIQQIAMPSISDAIHRAGRVTLSALPITVLAVIALLVVLPFLGLAYPEYVVRFFAPGFRDQTLATGASLLAILIPLLPIAVITGLLLTFLGAAGVFFFGEMTKVFQRAVLVLFLIALVPPMTIYAVGWTMLGAGIISVIALLIGAWVVHRRHVGASLETVVPDPAKPEPRGRIIAALLIFAYYQVNVIIDFAAASTLATGTVAAMEYGSRLVSLLPGLVTASLSTVLYPEIVRFMGGDDREKAAGALRKLLRGSLFLQIPASLALALTASYVISLLFGHGGFDSNAQAQTVQTTVIYSVAAIFLMPIGITINAIFADAHESPLPDIALLGAGSIALRIILIAYAVPLYGLHGLGAAVLVTTAASCTLALYICWRRYPQFGFARFAREMLTIAACSVAALATGLAMQHIMPDGRGVLHWLVNGFCIAVPALVAYAMAAFALGQAEARQVGAAIDRLRAKSREP